MITQGYLSRHFQGRRGMADAALLDVAQDYALKFLKDQGLFELGVVLKGGTSLRKLRVGNAGRFSTDLDFAAPDVETGELLLDTIDGAQLFDVRFTLTDRETLRARLVVNTPLGQPQIPARIEISPRGLWLHTEAMVPVDLPAHAGYEFDARDSRSSVGGVALGEAGRLAAVAGRSVTCTTSSSSDEADSTKR
jgi:predicted nucleotidyltransferase component of viral defense system